MFGSRYLVPTLLVCGTALGQNGCNAPTNTIQNDGDAMVLANCPILSGDLVISENAAGTVRLPGIQRIQGSLISHDAVNLNGIEAPQLAMVDKTFDLSGLTILANLNFPSLFSVGGIRWTALPALSELSFTRQITRASGVSITNTNLKSLDGINLEQVKIFDVTNNPYLTKIEAQLGNITQSLTLQANSKDLVASFPNLQWAYNMTFRNCSDVRLPSLASVNGSMGFFDNFFQSFVAPNLTMTGPGGSLVFVSNQALTNISMPNLKSIGGTYQIANNTQLKSIDGFTQLATVNGAIDFSGNFTNVTLSSLKDVRGAFNIQTSSQFDCTPFQNAKNSQIIKGRFNCTGNTQHPGTVTSTGSSSSTSSSTGSSPSKANAAGQMQMHVRSVVAASVFVAGWLFWSC